MPYRTLLSLLTLTLLCLAPAQAQETEAASADTLEVETPEAQALVAATHWLALLDAGDFAESWAQSAALFQAALTADQWEETLVGLYAQLGGLGERSFTQSTYTTELPNTPPGEYVMVQYRTAFDAGTMTETVVMMKDGDAWKAAGYFVQP